MENDLMLTIKTKDYLFHILSMMSIRQCIKDEDFIIATGIRTKSSLEKAMKMFNINTETLYKYAIENKIVPAKTTFLEFKNQRSNDCYFKNIVSSEKFFKPKMDMKRKEELINKILQAGFYADSNMSLEEIETLSNSILIEENNNE